MPTHDVRPRRIDVLHIWTHLGEPNQETGHEQRSLVVCDAEEEHSRCVEKDGDDDHPLGSEFHQGDAGQWA